MFVFSRHSESTMLTKIIILVESVIFLSIIASVYSASQSNTNVHRGVDKYFTDDKAKQNVKWEVSDVLMKTWSKIDVSIRIFIKL